VRTSGPEPPSGRRPASTGQATSAQTRIISLARRVAVRSAGSSASPGSGSATNTTSTSLT
jgi:hypothetical protein